MRVSRMGSRRRSSALSGDLRLVGIVSSVVAENKLGLNEESPTAAGEAKEDLAVAYQAMHEGNLDFLRGWLQRYQGNVDVRNPHGWTLLHYAAANNCHGPILEYLLRSRANIDATANNGWTALHFAAYNNHPIIVEQLLKCGADVTIKDDCGDTAEDIAELSRNPQTAGLLKDHILRLQRSQEEAAAQQLQQQLAQEQQEAMNTIKTSTSREEYQSQIEQHREKRRARERRSKSRLNEVQVALAKLQQDEDIARNNIGGEEQMEWEYIENDFHSEHTEITWKKPAVATPPQVVQNDEQPELQRTKSKGRRKSAKRESKAVLEQDFTIRSHSDLIRRRKELSRRLSQIVVPTDAVRRPSEMAVKKLPSGSARRSSSTTTIWRHTSHNSSHRASEASSVDV